MKKFGLLIVTMLFAFNSGIQAQNVDDNDTEITVTNKKGEKEVIDLPEALSFEYDSLLSVYNAKTYLKRDVNCDKPDINPVYEKEVYKERLSRIPSVMEMPYNEVVQKLIDRYSGHLRRSVSLMLGTQNFYMPIFEEALESYGLPLELKYLPVIESALNPNAVSRVGATGLWQFMLHTGKQYGLEINSFVDERRDPIKASYAAAHYLSDLYKIFGDWNLVIAAYNCGPQGINKAIHRAKGRTKISSIAGLEPGTPACFEAMVISNPQLSRIRKGMELVKVRVADETGRVDLVFFNQPYVKDQLVYSESYRFYGALRDGFGCQMQNPAFEKTDAAGAVTGRILPIYPLTAGISNKLLGACVRQALAACAGWHRRSACRAPDCRRRHSRAGCPQ